MAKQRNKIKNDVIKQIRLLLGDGMIDIELDPEHYDLAIDIAVIKYDNVQRMQFKKIFYTHRTYRRRQNILFLKKYQK